MSNYSQEIYESMCEEEQYSQCPNILKGQVHITKFLRAYLIDWLAHANYCLDIEDRSVYFLAVSLMDRFYDNQDSAKSASDL